MLSKTQLHQWLSPNSLQSVLQEHKPHSMHLDDPLSLHLNYDADLAAFGVGLLTRNDFKFCKLNQQLVSKDKLLALKHESASTCAML